MERWRYIYEDSWRHISSTDKDENINPIQNFYKKQWAEWFKANTQDRPDGNDIIAQRMRELSPMEFKIWESENIYTYTNKKGELMEVWAGELVTPNDAYLNSDFSQLEGIPKFMEIYDKFREYKEESDDSLPEYMTSSYEFRFSMPQIDIKFFDAIYEASKWFSGGKGIGKRLRELLSKVKYLVKSTYKDRPDDELFKREIIVDKNLPSISTPPIRFIEKLDHPKYLSRDLTGSLMLYMGMAENYREMTNALPYFNALVESARTQKFATRKVKTTLRSLVGGVDLRKIEFSKIPTHGNILREGSSTTYKAIQDLMNINVYGAVKPNTKIRLAGREINLAKLTKLSEGLAKWKRDVNLKANYPAIVQGIVSAYKEAHFEKLAGRNYNSENWNWALGKFMNPQNYVAILADFERPIKTNKISALGQAFFVLDSNRDQFRDLDKARFARMIQKSSHYGTWRMADFSIRHKVMLAIMDNYRLIDGKWYTKEQYLGLKDKYQTNEGRKESWDANKNNNFYNKIEFTEKGLKYDPSIKEANINFINNRIRAVNRDITTQKSDLDNAYIEHTLVGTWLMMHKAFLRLGIFRRLKRRHRNFVTGKWEVGSFEGALKTGITGIDSVKNFFTQKENIDLKPEDREGFVRTILEFMWLQISFLISYAVLGVIDDDDEERKPLLAFLQYLAIRNYLEAATFLWVEDFANMVMRPLAGVDLLADMQKVLPFTTDNIWFKNKELENSPYKTARQKVLTKLVPGYRGFYETVPMNTPISNSGVALPLKRGFIQNKVIGNAVPTSMFDILMNFPDE
jgi:hypothetical protein